MKEIICREYTTSEMAAEAGLVIQLYYRAEAKHLEALLKGEQFLNVMNMTVADAVKYAIENVDIKSKDDNELKKDMQKTIRDLGNDLYYAIKIPAGPSVLGTIDSKSFINANKTCINNTEYIVPKRTKDKNKDVNYLKSEIRFGTYDDVTMGYSINGSGKNNNRR